MLIPGVACLVLIFLGRDELGIRSILGIVCFLVISGCVMAVFHVQPQIFIVVLVFVDVYLILKLFGSDIRIR